MKSKHGYPINPGLWGMVFKSDKSEFYQAVSKDSFCYGILKECFEEALVGEAAHRLWLMADDPWEPEESDWSLEYQLLPTQLMQWSDD